jgi:hypothetical protein
MKNLVLYSIIGLLLLVGVAYAIILTVAPATVPTIAIVPPEKVAVIVPIVDVTPKVPEVTFIGITTVSPEDLSKSQGFYQNIVVTFDEAMDPATINANTFMIKGPNGVSKEGRFTSDATKRIWTFNPTYALTLNTLYTVTITTGAKGVSGDALKQDFVWTFTTAQGSSGSGGGGGGSTSCSPNWQCGAWGVCQPNSTQSRTCTDANNCGVLTGKPAVSQSCVYTATPVLTKITLTPQSATLDVADKQLLTATSLDQFDAPFATTISYNSSNTSVATVNSTGAVTAVAAGTATITASSGTVSNTSSISVVTAGAACPAVSVNLGTSGNFAILAKSKISTTGTTFITGDIGVSPNAATYITGFGLILDATECFSTSTLVSEKIYAADYNTLGCTTPAMMSTAVSDMETAYTTTAGLADCVTELGAGEIGGMTLAPGTYKWGTGLLISTDVTLSGNATDVWVFEVAGTLGLANAKQVKLTGGALAKNVYWVIGDVTSLGTTSVMNGNILSAPGVAVDNAIVLNTGATLNGRALSQKGVTLDGNAVTKAV